MVEACLRPVLTNRFVCETPTGLRECGSLAHAAPAFSAVAGTHATWGSTLASIRGDGGKLPPTVARIQVALGKSTIISIGKCSDKIHTRTWTSQSSVQEDICKSLETCVEVVLCFLYP